MRKFFLYTVAVFSLALVSKGLHAQVEQDSTSVVIVEDTAEEDTETATSDLREEDSKALEVRKVKAEDVEKIKKDDAFWYVDEWHKKVKKPVEEEKDNWFGKLLKTNWFQPLMWVLVVGTFIGILIWFLSTMDVSVFRKNPKKISDPNEDEIPENIFEIDFDKAINTAVNGGNFRLAVRLLYLQLLKELSENDIIHYNPQRPNSEYVMQLYGTKYYQPFFSITRNFEYAWYGGFHVSPLAYEKIRAEVSGIKSGFA
jgi:hypothetical protein